MSRIGTLLLASCCPVQLGPHGRGVPSNETDQPQPGCGRVPANVGKEDPAVFVQKGPLSDHGQCAFRLRTWTPATSTL
jgi:hypothetical protein